MSGAGQGVLSEKSAVRYPTPTYGTMTRRPIEGAMPNIFPLQFLLATCSGWVNRQQGQVADYLIEGNRVLKEQLRGKRLRLTDDQRRRLAAKGKALGRRLLAQGRWCRIQSLQKLRKPVSDDSPFGWSMTRR